MNNIAEVYEEWQEETGVKIIAISIDDTRSMSKVAPYVNSSDWEYEVYLDSNSDLKRAMGVSTVPTGWIVEKSFCKCKLNPVLFIWFCLNFYSILKCRSPK